MCVIRLGGEAKDFDLAAPCGGEETEEGTSSTRYSWLVSWLAVELRSFVWDLLWSGLRLALLFSCLSILCGIFLGYSLTAPAPVEGIERRERERERERENKKDSFFILMTAQKILFSPQNARSQAFFYQAR